MYDTAHVFYAITNISECDKYSHCYGMLENREMAWECPSYVIAILIMNTRNISISERCNQNVSLANHITARYSSMWHRISSYVRYKKISASIHIVVDMREEGRHKMSNQGNPNNGKGTTRAAKNVHILSVVLWFIAKQVTECIHASLLCPLQCAKGQVLCWQNSVIWVV